MNSGRSNGSALKEDLALRACIEVLSKLDEDRPGRGHDVYHSDAFDYPDAYGLILHAAARVGHKEIAERCGNWLVAHSHLSPTGRTGWGLPFAYQTFGNAPNPPNTVYGITTAIVVSGLLGFYQASGREEALQCATCAMEQYAQFFSGDHFQYSEVREDRLAVPNVDAMLAGQYARLAVALRGRGQVQDAKRFQDIAVRASRYILSGMRRDGAMRYAEGSQKKNDAVHYAYIYSGVRAVSELVEFPDDRLSVVRTYAGQFFDHGRLREYPRPEFKRRLLEHFGVRPVHEARLWGLGAWLAATRGESLSGVGLSRLLGRYRASGTFVVSPTDDRVSVRHLAHLAWGLSELTVQRGSGKWILSSSP